MGLRAFCAAVVLLSVLAHVSANSQSPSRAGAADHFENAAIQASRSRSGRQLTAASRDPSLQIRGVNIYQKKTGKLIKLKGLGWYGWNIPQYGLTFGNANTGDSVTRNFRSNLWRIKRLGFNSLRLAFTFDILTRPIRTRPQQCSVASRGAIINSILYPGFSPRVPKQVPPSVRGGVCNAGMPSSGRVWDQFVWAVKEATNAGFYVVLDYHSNKNGDQAFYNPTYFLQSWKKLLKDRAWRPHHCT